MVDVTKILKQTQHRPWLLPRQPWLMSQTWANLLFAHWPVDNDQLQALLPSGLTLDTFEGQAWVSVVPFRMGYQLRFVPFGVKFGELNLRTYVIKEGKPGVFFLSLDAADPGVVLASRKICNLPYFQADAKIKPEGDGFRFVSQRQETHPYKARFQATYRPVSEGFYAKPGTLEHWLTERYCFYSAAPDNQLFRGEVHHLPWSLQHAEANITENTLLSDWSLNALTTDPILHYAKGLDIVVWMPQRIAD